MPLHLWSNPSWTSCRQKAGWSHDHVAKKPGGRTIIRLEDAQRWLALLPQMRSGTGARSDDNSMCSPSKAERCHEIEATLRERFILARRYHPLFKLNARKR
jgi:hypothetical protein